MQPDQTTPPEQAPAPDQTIGGCQQDAGSVRWVELHPDFLEDEKQIKPDDVGVWEETSAKDMNQMFQKELPITPRAESIGELKKAVTHLVQNGSPCWPGHIEPLKPGQRYLVTIAGEWFALVGIPGQNDRTLATQPAKEDSDSK